MEMHVHVPSTGYYMYTVTLHGQEGELEMVSLPPSVMISCNGL